MTQTIITRDIKASIDMVFKVIGTPSEFEKVVPDIVAIKILSDIKQGPGTRFCETRMMNGKEVSYEMEITEYVENEKVRIVSDAGGSIWDTVFTVTQKKDFTHLEMNMQANARGIIARIMNIIMKGMIKKAIEKDMDRIKTYCESTK